MPDTVNVFCRQTFEVRQPLKQTVAPKVKLFTCFWWVRSTHLLFCTIFSNISRTETAHLLLRIMLWSFTAPEILLNVLRWIFCWSKSNQVNKQLATLHVNIRLTPTQTSTVRRQLERVFFRHVYTLRCNRRLMVCQDRTKFFFRLFLIWFSLVRGLFKVLKFFTFKVRPSSKLVTWKWIYLKENRKLF